MIRMIILVFSFAVLVIRMTLRPLIAALENLVWGQRRYNFRWCVRFDDKRTTHFVKYRPIVENALAQLRRMRQGEGERERERDSLFEFAAYWHIVNALVRGDVMRRQGCLLCFMHGGPGGISVGNVRP